jgi:hypothetical protein
MNPGQVSFFAMFAGAMLAAFLIAYRRPGLGKAAAAIFTGLVIGAFNIGLEYYASEHKIYFVSGLIPIARSSLALSIGWVSLTASYTLGSESLKESERPWPALLIYIAAGVAGGMASDYLGEIYTHHFRMGAEGSWLFIFLVWAAMVPAAIGIYKLTCKILG